MDYHDLLILRIQTAFHVSYRRRIRICEGERDGPCHIHSYLFQVGLISFHIRTHLNLSLSLAFLLYGFIVFLVNLYSTTGRNAVSSTIFNADASNIEMVTPGGRSKWYSRVPTSRTRTRSGLAESTVPTHVLGDEDEEEEVTPRMEMMNVAAGRRV